MPERASRREVVYFRYLTKYHSNTWFYSLRSVTTHESSDPWCELHDPLMGDLRTVFVDGAIVIGAGPSGMATTACLKVRDVPFVILERSECIASLWKKKTYDRLRMHVPKDCCRLPLLPFPENYPTFITRKDFIKYLEDYASKFDLQPKFNEIVESARFEESSKTWHVRTRNVKYIGRWLVVATGENAEIVMPEFRGLDMFKGKLIHSSFYKNGEDYKGKKVLVVGSGNSGMEIALDLVNHGAETSIAVRSTVHILPHKMFWKSTFSVGMWMMKHLPVWLVDFVLVSYSLLTLGDTGALGLKRPKMGPLELKQTTGKTPVLDVGTLALIKRRYIKVKPGVDCLTEKEVRFTNGLSEEYDALILATGYRSNVPRWLQDDGHFFAANGLPKSSLPNNWKGKNGLYAAGLNRKGILGAAIDAQLIAADIYETSRTNHM